MPIACSQAVTYFNEYHSALFIPCLGSNKCFLVFFFVGIIGFFPKTAFYYGTTLLVPVSIGIILLAIRGSYYAFETYGAQGHKGYSFMYGIAGILFQHPFYCVDNFRRWFRRNGGRQSQCLIIGAVHQSVDMEHCLFSIAAILYISAVFLTWYANKARDAEATDSSKICAHLGIADNDYGRQALFSNFRTIIQSITAYPKFWPMFLISFFMFVGTVWLIWKRRNYGLAFLLLVGQFTFAFFGYGQLPLSVLALSVLDDLRQLHEPSDGHFA